MSERHKAEGAAKAYYNCIRMISEAFDLEADRTGPPREAFKRIVRVAARKQPAPDAASQRFQEKVRASTAKVRFAKQLNEERARTKAAEAKIEELNATIFSYRSAVTLLESEALLRSQRVEELRRMLASQQKKRKGLFWLMSGKKGDELPLQ